jgi:lipopolysaccharide heptosyltransferase II
MSSPWDSARNILGVRLDSLGDVLMCTPALRALRRSQPGRRLTLLTSPSAALVAPFIPEIDEVIAYAAPWMKSSPDHEPAADLACAARLAARGFDAAVIFTTYSQSALPAALLCYLADIPLRLAHCRENPYQLLTDWVPEPEPQQQVRHEVRRQLDLVGSVGCATTDAGLSFALREHDLRTVRQQLRDAGVDPAGRWLLLHPGASAPSRRYPRQHWAELIRQLTACPGWPVVMTGGADETELVDAIRAASGVPVVSLAGRLNLGELAAAMRLASAVVCNNSGPAHLASAVGTPVVVTYALTNPQHTPWQVASRLLYHDVPCRFCHKSVCPQGHHDCLDKVAPARVADAVCSLLGGEDTAQQCEVPAGGVHAGVGAASLFPASY